MRRHFASEAFLNLSLIAGAFAQTAPPAVPPPKAAPATDCPMHDHAGGHMMQPGAMPMTHGHPMPQATEHCPAMRGSTASEKQQHMMHRPGEAPLSQKQEKDQ